MSRNLKKQLRYRRILYIGLAVLAIILLIWLGYQVISYSPATNQIDSFQSSTSTPGLNPDTLPVYDPAIHKNIIIPYVEGGLGNQLYFISQAYIYAKRFGKTLYLKYVTDLPSYGKPRPTYFTSIFRNIPVLKIDQAVLDKFNRVPETELDTDKHGNIYLTGGYFQKPAILEPYLGELRELFQPTPEIQSSISSIIRDQEIQINRDIFLHIRLGDDWTPSTFGNVYTPDELDNIRQYILAQLQQDPETKIILFSNNADKALELFSQDEIITRAIRPMKYDEITELYLMAQGRRFIASPSTFMIWGIMLSSQIDKEIKILWSPDSSEYRRDFYSQYSQLLKAEKTASSNNIQYYLINLAKNPERLAKFDTQAQKLGIKYTRFNAVYGKDLSPNDPRLAKFIAQPTSLNPGQVGCALSHLTLLEQIMADPAITQESIVCIFEDDVILPADFTKKGTGFLGELNVLDPDWRFGLLGVLLCNGYKTANPGIIQAYPGQHNYGLHAYLVKKRSIKHMLDHITKDKVAVPVDDYYINNFYSTGSYIINPVLVKQDRTLASDINVGLGIDDYTCKIITK